MKKIYCILLMLLAAGCWMSLQAQTATGDNWQQQYAVLKNTAEAEIVIRTGDIDNLGFGWAEGFNPFSGKSTDVHGYPWDTEAEDATGTDRIFVISGYQYGKDWYCDGYTNTSERPLNKPVPVVLPLEALKDITIQSATLQLFIDDFQSTNFQCKYQVKLNGKRFIEAEKVINTINQSGPIGKLITLKLTNEMLSVLKADSLVLFIEDAVTTAGDGFAIDFVRLLVNPKGHLYKGNIRGIVIDAETRQPIKDAAVKAGDVAPVQTNTEGIFLLEGVPAGLNVVQGSAAGYSSARQQVDVVTTETTEDVVLELWRSGDIKYDDKTLKEGDNLVMKNIQFELGSANLLVTGKKELDKLAAFMKQNETVEILLTGHTSLDGSASFNKELSLQRVSSCKSYLVGKGIDEGRITVEGYGSDRPIAPNDTEKNRALNRRVEMQVTRL